MEVKDKVCIITGSAQGLGKAFAKILLHNGAKVCLSDMKEEALKTTFNEFVDFYGNFTMVMFHEANSRSAMKLIFILVKMKACKTLSRS